MKCTLVCAAQTTYSPNKKPDFPCLADEIAEPSPDLGPELQCLLRVKEDLS